MASAHANGRATALTINHQPFKIRRLLFSSSSFLPVRFECCRRAPDLRLAYFPRLTFSSPFSFSISFLFLWGLPRLSSFLPLVLCRYSCGRQGLLPVALFSPSWILVQAYRPRDGKYAQGRDSFCESGR